MYLVSLEICREMGAKLVYQAPLRPPPGLIMDEEWERCYAGLPEPTDIKELKEIIIR